MKNIQKIQKIYNYLLMSYGYQGWFPLLDIYKYNKKKKKKLTPYHPYDYSYPKSKSQRFEIIVGCILTQNSSFDKVQEVIFALDSFNLLKPKKIINSDENKIKEIIKPTGYFNQKYDYLVNISNFFLKYKRKAPDRVVLLNIKGVGEESADSILLYAYKKPYFVVDSYTKRILTNLNIIDKNYNYNQIQNMFHEFFRDLEIKEKIKVYQEFHALLVTHAKKYYRKKEDYKKDPLLSILK